MAATSPEQFPIVDPFEALPLLAASLSSPGHQFDTVSGWIVTLGGIPQGQESDDFLHCAPSGLATCVLRSPEGELFDFGSQAPGASRGRRSGEWAFKVSPSAMSPTASSRSYLNTGLMGTQFAPGRTGPSVACHVVPFRHDSGLDPKAAGDRMLHHNSRVQLPA